MKKSKEKTEARALQAALGVSYQTALNALRANDGNYQKAYDALKAKK